MVVLFLHSTAFAVIEKGGVSPRPTAPVLNQAVLG